MAARKASSSLTPGKASRSRRGELLLFFFFLRLLMVYSLAGPVAAE